MKGKQGQVNIPGFSFSPLGAIEMLIISQLTLTRDFNKSHRAFHVKVEKWQRPSLSNKDLPFPPFAPCPAVPSWRVAGPQLTGDPVVLCCTVALLPPPSCLPAGQGFPSSILPELKNYFHTFILGIHNHVSCCSFSQNAHLLSIWSCPIVLFLPIIVASFMTY